MRRASIQRFVTEYARRENDRLLEQGARTVVLKMGRNGCLVARGSDRIQVPSLPAKVVDTTRAGDCWDAGFIAGLASGEDILAAARIGNACAAFGIEAVGCSTGLPDYSAVRRRADAPVSIRPQNMPIIPNPGPPDLSYPVRGTKLVKPGQRAIRAIDTWSSGTLHHSVNCLNRSIRR
jgi:hypothetical protein